jgi:hypothetical protein
VKRVGEAGGSLEVQKSGSPKVQESKSPGVGRKDVQKTEGGATRRVVKSQ